MKVIHYFSTTDSEISSKKSNIFIPICLGNKFFSYKNIVNENVEHYLKWSIEHTKEKVLIIVVDKIQDTNYFVRNSSRTEQASLRRVLKDGQEIKTGIEEIIRRYNDKNISVINWQEYEDNDPYWKSITDIVYEEFKNNIAFRDGVIEAVKKSITDRTFTYEEYLKLSEYVLDEFCIVYAGATLHNEYYGLYVYPDTDAVLELIENIKSGDRFPELLEKLPKEKVGVVILNQ